MASEILRQCAAAIEPLAPALVGVAVGGMAVLGVAGLAALAMRRRASAAARHAVWLMGLVAVLVLPALSAALPGWHVLPGRGGALGATARPDGSAAIPTILGESNPSSVSSSAAAEPKPGAETIAAKTTQRSPSGDPSPTVAGAAPQRANPPVSPAAAPQVGRSGGLPWTLWLLPCWALGAVLVLSRVLLGHLGLWRLRRQSARVTRGDLFDLLERLRRELQLRRRVELLSRPAQVMPMTWGLWRVRLLVPEEVTAWPQAQRRDVLLHELGHVRRWDCLTQLVAQLACAAYWFNPLAWVAARRMQVERERACDDLVLNDGGEAPAYARHLLASVSSVLALRPIGAAAAAMARPSMLEERVRAILDARLNRRGLTRRRAIGTILLLLPALVPAAMLRAQQDAKPADGGPQSPAATRSAVTTRPTGRPGFGAPRFGGRGFGGDDAAPALGEGPTCTLDATLYDVRIPADQTGKLDVEALMKAADSADAFEKALAALGPTKPMYRANQSVRLSGDTITIGTQVPVVTNSRVTDRGQTINTVQYQSTGARFTIAGKAGAPGGAVDLDLGIQVSSSSAEDGTPIAGKVKAPVMRRVSLSHKGAVRPGKPFVVVSVDAGSVDADGKAVAYIGRVTVGEPQPPAPR
ncbi:MAG TPA: M56 family metallopeptidase [Tepidisphaeraceae bacterium]|jgi:beta-lactamase regulating signal transducer with metallopeptidase domain